MAFDQDITRWLNTNRRDITATVCFRRKNVADLNFLYALEDGVLVAAEKAQLFTSRKNEYAFLPYTIMNNCDGYGEFGLMDNGLISISCDYLQDELTLENLDSTKSFLSLKSRDVNVGGFMSKEETRNIQESILKKYCDDANFHFANMDILAADDLYDEWRLFNHKRCTDAQTFVNAVREKIGLPSIGDFTMGRYLDRLTEGGRRAQSLLESALEKTGEILKGNTGIEGSDEPTQTESALDQIKKLAELRDAGVITEDEFQAKKKELLGRI